MPKRRGHRVKRRTHKEVEANTEDPRSFVVKRGPVGKSVSNLISNLRDVMLPYSAKNLKESKATKLKDLISVASVFNVTHVQMFTEKDSGVFYRIAGVPNGPTLTFQVHEFSLMQDVRASQKRPRASQKDFHLSPLVVLNGFRKNIESATNPQQAAGLTIASKVLTNMFPAVDVEKVDVSVCRRTVLFNRNPTTGLIEMRHYAVVSRPAGVSRAVRKLLTVNPNKLPKLGDKEDLADYFENAGAASDSEFEDAQQVSSVKRAGQKQAEQMALSLIELGPRMTLELVKVEDGVCGGDVVFEKSVKPVNAKKKSKEEKADAAKRRKVIKEEESEEEDDDEQEDEEETDDEIDYGTDSEDEEDDDEEDEESEEGANSSDEEDEEADE